MPEPDRTTLDARLEAAVRAYADGASTHVDAVAVAERAAQDSRRWGGWGVLSREVPVPVALVLATGLLLLLALGTLTAGSRMAVPWLTDRSTTEASSPAVLPTWNVYPITDAVGAERLSGSETVALAAGSGFAVATAMNDARVTGLGTWRPDPPIDPSSPALVQGPFHLETASGAWDGTCSGMARDRAHAITADCWLAGSGAYDGLTWYRQFTWRFADHWSYTGGIARGVIYPGQPPAR
jgi:hypothetical protein